MERIFLKKKSFPAIIVQLPQKNGFPPFARRSLPSGNSGVPIRAASPAVRFSAHENKRVLRKQKPQHASACKHPGYKPVRAQKRTQNCVKNTRISKRIAKKRTKMLKKMSLFRNLSKICPEKNAKPKICGFYSLFFAKNSFSD